MSTTLERLLSEAKSLSSNEREILAAALDFDAPDDETGEAAAVEAAWEGEIASRVEGIESGKVTLLDHTQFMSVFEEARAEVRSLKMARS
jgi:hypothetical protein